MMQKAFPYRGFLILVQSEELTVGLSAFDSDSPLGYLAAVEVMAEHQPPQRLAEFEVSAPHGRLFQREAEVYAGGYHAATAMIDKALKARVYRNRHRAECKAFTKFDTVNSQFKSGKFSNMLTLGGSMR